MAFLASQRSIELVPPGLRWKECDNSEVSVKDMDTVLMQSKDEICAVSAPRFNGS